MPSRRNFLASALALPAFAAIPRAHAAPEPTPDLPKYRLFTAPNQNNILYQTPEQRQTLTDRWKDWMPVHCYASCPNLYAAVKWDGPRPEHGIQLILPSNVEWFAFQYKDWFPYTDKKPSQPMIGTYPVPGDAYPDLAMLAYDFALVQIIARQVFRNVDAADPKLPWVSYERFLEAIRPAYRRLEQLHDGTDFLYGAPHDPRHQRLLAWLDDQEVLHPFQH